MAAITFSEIFWVSSHTESLIFGNANFNEMLTNSNLVMVTLILFGFGPMRFTLPQGTGGN